jgi:hypothetical protein
VVASLVRLQCSALSRGSPTGANFILNRKETKNFRSGNGWNSPILFSVLEFSVLGTAGILLSSPHPCFDFETIRPAAVKVCPHIVDRPSTRKIYGSVDVSVDIDRWPVDYVWTVWTHLNSSLYQTSSCSV